MGKVTVWGRKQDTGDQGTEEDSELWTEDDPGKQKLERDGSYGHITCLSHRSLRLVRFRFTSPYHPRGAVRVTRVTRVGRSRKWRKERGESGPVSLSIVSLSCRSLPCHSLHSLRHERGERHDAGREPCTVGLSSRKGGSRVVCSLLIPLLTS